MFCQKCGKELPDDAKFCQYCGVEINTSEQREDIKPEKTQNTGCAFLFGVIVVLFFLFVLISNSENDNASSVADNSSKNNASCPSVSEMEDAIKQYKEGKIIYKFDPNLNTVYITPLAEKQLLADDLKVLGYITACYSGYVKGNNLHWADIYSTKTNKKLAKFSESYGFKMY